MQNHNCCPYCRVPMVTNFIPKEQELLCCATCFGWVVYQHDRFRPFDDNDFNRYDDDTLIQMRNITEDLAAHAEQMANMPIDIWYDATLEAYATVEAAAPQYRYDAAKNAANVLTILAEQLFRSIR